MILLFHKLIFMELNCRKIASLIKLNNTILKNLFNNLYIISASSVLYHKRSTSTSSSSFQKNKNKPISICYYHSISNCSCSWCWCSLSLLSFTDVMIENSTDSGSGISVERLWVWIASTQDQTIPVIQDIENFHSKVENFH